MVLPGDDSEFPIHPSNIEHRYHGYEPSKNRKHEIQRKQREKLVLMVEQKTLQVVLSYFPFTTTEV